MEKKMPSHTDEFWDHLREKWHPDSDDPMRRATHSILFHLRRRLPHEEVEALFDCLPGEIVGLSFSPDFMKEGRSLARPAERQEDATEFYATVAREANLSADEAAQATEALFHAIKQEMRPRQIVAVASVLPKQLMQAWERA
jgi:uncharacterized protein (DUF2267 family)